MRFAPAHRPSVAGAAAAAVVALAALAACSPATKSGPQSTGSGSAGTTGSTFVVARTADIDKLDPQQATAFQTIETLGLVYDSLVDTDAGGKLVGDLATSWTTSSDGRTVTFALRTGVSWHDGDPFTAADVKASLDRLLDEKTGAAARSNLTSIASVQTPSDSQVVLKLNKPDAALLYALASTNSAILHAKDITAGTVDKQPDGTGPFAWKQWDQGQQVTLTGNPKYFAGAPKIGTLQFRVIPAESSILSGMKAGAFGLGILSDPGVAKQATGSQTYRLVKQSSLSYHALMLNGRRGPLKSQLVRQAIACAIDRGQVVRTAAFGDGTVTGPITSPAFRYSATAGLPCTPGDTAAAKRMLANAGYPNGFSLNTIVMTGQYATAVGEGQNLQAQLAKIGVQLKLQQLTTAPYVKSWLAADYDAAVALNGGSADPYLMYGRYFTAGGSLSAPGGLTSTSLASLLNRGNATTNAAQRTSTYADLQRQLLAQSPWVWLFTSEDYYLVNSKVQGFTARADESLSSLATTSG